MNARQRSKICGDLDRSAQISGTSSAYKHLLAGANNLLRLRGTGPALTSMAQQLHAFVSDRKHFQKHRRRPNAGKRLFLIYGSGSRDEGASSLPALPIENNE